MIRARFVYEIHSRRLNKSVEVFGEWTSVKECLDDELPMRPSERFPKVSRVEFQVIGGDGNEVPKKER